MRSEREVRDKLESFDSWRYDPGGRRRNATPRDRAIIEALQWVLEIDPQEYDTRTRDADPDDRAPGGGR
jgi:hypothetical protein